MDDLDWLLWPQIDPTPNLSVADPPSEKRLLLRPSDVARLLSVSRTTLRRWDIAGAIPSPVKVGRAKFWSTRTLETWERLGCPSRRAFEAIEAEKQ